ncbi:MAG TPA: hypothetical protein VNE62_05365 [Actinomycetota bacterium]|nr:hypothetical protein [Actinomycetota bacterium]
MRHKKMKRLGVTVFTLAAAAAVAAGAIRTAGADDYAVLTAADPSDGAALVHEAIENVRGMERFRFTQRVAGAGSALDPASGVATAAADLSSGTADPPRYHAVTQLKGRDGAGLAVEQVAIGEDLHVKLPKEQRFRKSDKKAKKSQGKKAGGAGQVDVVDPVMSLLEPVDNLPPSSFGQPSAPDSEGIRTVTVSIAEGASLVLKIDDAEHLVRHVSYAKGSAQAEFTLKDFGSSSIHIPDPNA